eukprot:TRINITY_DN5414_c1_g2_i2.p1 TRINITY_DN5414_c1_g2~~TRINITY_DN5414_c1_g2_i2.p1  ORF type:complete len:453 (-),score=99.89 TRINITY_DN5414_c1_g2_i2:99-1457(-)
MAQLKLFGLPLAREGRVPDIFEICLSFIELHARDTQGIFRISGNKLKIQQIKEEFESGQRLDFEPSDDIHDVAGIFRLWMMSLPEPLVPFDFYQKFLELGKGFDGSKKQLSSLKKLIQSLPQLRLTLLVRLCRLLRILSVNSDVNRMSPENLAIVMAPNVLRPQGDKVSLDALVETQVVTKILAVMIANYDVVLDTIDVPPPPSPRSLEAAEGEDNETGSGKKRFQPKLVKGHFEEKYGLIREGSNPLSGKKVSDMEVMTPERLAQSQGSKRPKLKLNVGAAAEDGDAKTRERSKSASKRRKDETEARRPLSARESFKRDGSNTSVTSSTSSGSMEEKKDSEEPRTRTRAESISKREIPTFNNALDWLLLAQGGGLKEDPSEVESVEQHNAEVRRKRDEEFERLQREREARKKKQEEKEKRRKERQRERARIMVETGTDPGSLSSSDSESES